MNNIIPFSFQSRKIRIVVVDDEHWFVAKDVAETLGYTNPSKAVGDHCKGVTKRYPLQTPGGVQEFRIIREPDLYRLIVGSTLPAAVEFEAWVFEEVLPALRREGAYGAREAAEPARLGEYRLPAEDYIALLRENNALLREKVAQLQSRVPRRPKEMRPLTNEDVEEIRRLKRLGLTGAEIARRVNRSAGVVSMICRDMNNQDEEVEA